MRQNKFCLITRQILFIFSILISQFQVIESKVDSDSSSTENVIFTINNYFEVIQKQTATTYELNLNTKSQNKFKYIIIDLNLFELESDSSLIVCLNFGFDILQDQKFKDEGIISCAFTDDQPRIKQLQQYLLVIDLKDPNFKIDKTPYLTIIYQNNQQQRIQPEWKLSKQLRYSTYLFYSNSKPCHGLCNGYHGACNQSTGKCECNQNYINIDCGTEVKELNFQKRSDIVNEIIQPQQFYFFKVNLANIIQTYNGDKISMIIKNQKQNSLVEINIFYSMEQLLQIQNQDSSFLLTQDPLKLPNFKQMCTNFLNQNNFQDQKQSNNTDSQSPNNNCFAIFSFKQILLQQSIVISFLLNSENIESTNQENQNQQKEQQNKVNLEESLEESTSNKKKTIIIVISVLSFTFIAMCFAFIKFKKYKQLSQATVLANNNLNQDINSQENNQINNQINNQVNHQINNQISVQVNSVINAKQNKYAFSKKKYLQEKLMDIITFESCDQSQLSIQKIPDNQNLNDNSICKEDSQKKQHKCPIKTENEIGSKNRQCCAICLTEFVYQEKVRQTICNHLFHIDCLSNWLNKIDNCPLCRQSFEIKDMIDQLSKNIESLNIGKRERRRAQNEIKQLKTQFESKNNEPFSISEEELSLIFTYLLSLNKQCQNESIDQDTFNEQNAKNFQQSPLLNYQINSPTSAQHSFQITSNITSCLVSPSSNNMRQRISFGQNPMDMQNNILSNQILSSTLLTSQENQQYSPLVSYKKPSSQQQFDEIKESDKLPNKSQIFQNSARICDINVRGSQTERYQA